MKSNKQRKTEIQAPRHKLQAKPRIAAEAASLLTPLTPPGSVACNPCLLKPYNSYGFPPFVARGYYLDIEFTCRDCGKHEIWKAAQQKWWYETAKGNVESCAIRCRACRRIERERKARAWHIQLDSAISPSLSLPQIHDNIDTILQWEH